MSVKVTIIVEASDGKSSVTLSASHTPGGDNHRFYAANVQVGVNQALSQLSNLMPESWKELSDG